MGTFGRLGIGTWGGSFGAVGNPREYPSREVLERLRGKCVHALRFAFEQGIRIVDTAPSYGAGFAEECVGLAIGGIRNDLFVITKVSGDVGSFMEVVESVKLSLERMGISYVDLLLLHWYPGNVGLKEVMLAMEQVRVAGLAKEIGVSNFSLEQFKEAQSYIKTKLYANEVEYSVLRRNDGRYTLNVESELLPYNRVNDVISIAYKVLALGAALKDMSVSEVVDHAFASGVDVVLFRSENELHIRELVEAVR